MRAYVRPERQFPNARAASHDGQHSEMSHLLRDLHLLAGAAETHGLTPAGQRKGRKGESERRERGREGWRRKRERETDRQTLIIVLTSFSLWSFQFVSFFISDSCVLVILIIDIIVIVITVIMC